MPPPLPPPPPPRFSESCRGGGGGGGGGSLQADSVITGNLPTTSYIHIYICAALIHSEWARCLAERLSDM